MQVLHDLAATQSSVRSCSVNKKHLAGAQPTCSARQRNLDETVCRWKDAFLGCIEGLGCTVADSGIAWTLPLHLAQTGARRPLSLLCIAAAMEDSAAPGSCSRSLVTGPQFSRLPRGLITFCERAKPCHVNAASVRLGPRVCRSGSHSSSGRTARSCGGS